MTNPNQALESAIVAAGANVAPRITPADIEASICNEFYFSAEDGIVGNSQRSGPPGTAVVHSENPHSLSFLTFCVLTLQNGFIVTGEAACASPENYNKAISERIARENAVAKIWPLMGYELRSKLASIPADHRDRVRAEAAELDERIAKLGNFGRGPVFAGLPAEEQGRMNDQLAAMESYSRILRDRIAAF